MTALKEVPTRNAVMTQARDENFPVASHLIAPQHRALILAGLKNHREVELYTYPGCDHAFARLGGEHYNAEAAATANGRTLAFFRKHL